MKIGQEVICIDDSFSLETVKRVKNLPKKDKIYTIKDITMCLQKHSIGLILENLDNLPLINDLNPNFSFIPSFDSKRFRPLIEIDNLEEEKIELMLI